MSMNKANYPSNWAEISKRIRERAGNKCEICGVENHRYIFRHLLTPERFMYFEDDEECYWRGHEYSEKAIRVVLTVAHLNHDTTDNRDGNLKALCQLHHLRHDAQYHAQNAAKTRKRKHEEKTGQMQLFSAGEGSGE